MRKGGGVRRRILQEQPWHWRQAASVQEGRANATGPDA